MHFSPNLFFLVHQPKKTLGMLSTGIVKPWKTTFDEQKQTSLRVMVSL